MSGLCETTERDNLCYKGNKYFSWNQKAVAVSHRESLKKEDCCQGN
jgi:hypothetical protein